MSSLLSIYNFVAGDVIAISAQHELAMSFIL